MKGPDKWRQMSGIRFVITLLIGLRVIPILKGSNTSKLSRGMTWLLLLPNHILLRPFHRFVDFPHILFMNEVDAESIWCIVIHLKGIISTPSKVTKMYYCLTPSLLWIFKMTLCLDSLVTCVMKPTFHPAGASVNSVTKNNQ